MKSIRKVVAAAGLAVLAALGTPTSAEAIPVIYVDPATQIAEVGDTVSVDIWISDLDESIGAFDVDLLFDDTILTGDDFAVDPDANFANDLDGLLSLGFDTGLVNIAESGDPAGDNLALNAFRLGTINFTAANLGNSLLTISYNDLSDEQGQFLLANTTQRGIVCVVEDATAPVNCQIAVPEPGLLALLSIGAAFGVRRFALARPRA